MKSSRRGIGMKGLGLSCALGTGLVGCAVLTVDVDVYKGALVNEEHVQLHQLTALATAAKPMLVQLRDKLEWPETEGVPSREATRCEKDDSTSWYRARYVEPPDIFIPEILPELNGKPACYPHFRDIRARLVNSVLSLYEDLDSKDFSPHGEKLRKIVRILKQTIPNPETDEEAFKKISSGFKSDDALKSEMLINLKQGYEKFLKTSNEQGVPRRSIEPLMYALSGISSHQGLGLKNETTAEKADGTTLEEKLIQFWSKSKEKFPEKQDVEKQSSKEESNRAAWLYDGRLPSRASWKYLGEAGPDSLLAQAGADLCRGDQAKKDSCKKTLRDRTKKLVDDYWNSRQATHDLWEEGLHLLVLIKRLDQNQPERYSTLRKQLLDLILSLTSVPYVVSALDRVQGTDQCSILKSLSVLDLMCGPRSDGPSDWISESVTKKSHNYYREALRKALTVHPEETAYFLLYLDSIEQNAPPLNGNAAIRELVKTANETDHKRPVRLGLTLSLVDNGDLFNSPNDLFQLVNRVSHGLAQGFERGRSVEGLHTLTEVFLSSHGDGNRSSNLDDQRKLTDALVEFSQKVLFLANHDWLVSPPGSAGLILGGGTSLLRGLFGDDPADWLSRSSLFGIGTSRVPQAEEQAYIRVLQAVGNSILLSANELRERDRYADVNKGKASAEVAAARSVYSPDPAKVITDLLTELEHDKQAAQTALDDAQARKPSIAEQIQTLTDKRATGAQNLDASKAKIISYETKFAPVEATYQVLLQHVSETEKSIWKRDWDAHQSKSRSDLATFLKTDSESLENKLTDIRNALTSFEVKKRDQYQITINYVLSPEALDDFAKYRAPRGTTPEKRSTLLGEFITHIQSLEDKGRKEIEGYKKDQDAQEAELGRVNEKIVALTAENAQIAKLPGKITQLQTARTEIASVQAGVLKDAEAIKEAKGGIPFVSPETIYSLIRSHLEKKSTDSSRTAQSILLSRTPPPGMTPPDPNDYKNPMEVMDTVIALLRHRQMEIVARFGKDSDEDKKATEAIENAYRHRAGMIYIRPSSAYLRTSFPSTSLQDDPNLAWDNMLLKQGLRNLPFSSELRDILDPSGKQDRSITSELDKQYWQNINRVRVSGAGSTNQALVKDDVGNWYVKQYFGDTERIWESAKNLALFSMSAKVPIDLAKQLNKATKPEEYAENSKETPTLQKVLEKHQGAYKTNTDEVKAKLERLHDKELKETLIAAWDAHKDLKDDATFSAELKQALEAEIAVWKEVATTLKEKADQDPGQAITKDVGALSRLGRMLSASITKISYSDITREEEELEEKTKKLTEELEAKKDEPEAEKKELDKKKTELEAESKKLKEKKAALEEKKKMAVSEVRKIVGGQVLDILNDRNRILGQYEQAIVFIGDAANPKEAKQDN
ncbi:MAG: hypothetical protein MRJ66_00490 [Nitrospira sp.]|nr:hypothetical protein [Nitrospira sp.]